jgi:hypothetical protein
MHVELRPHKGLNLVTKREQYFEQYLVYAGHPEKLEMVGLMEMVGLIGWKEGSRLLFLKPVDPISRDEIKSKVDIIMKKEVEAINHPDLDQDLVTPPTMGTEDEFDESDLT